MSAATRDRLTALAVLVAAFVVILAAQRDVGIARDEVVYMNAGSRYADWWVGFVKRKGVANERAITATWGGKGATDNNREHPPLMKTLLGLSEKLFHDTLGWTSELTGYRLPGALLGAIGVALVFGFACAVWGYLEGLVAAALALLLPRALFHAGLACFDAPIATLWFATVVAYWKALSSRRWSWGLGVVFGLALATKHNAIILPVVVVTHYLWVAMASRRAVVAARHEHVRTAPGTSRAAALARMIGPALRELGVGLGTRRPWAVIAMLVVGPLVLLALWPWLWLDPVGHARSWIGFHLDHVHYNFEYLGTNWNHPPFPWHVAIVTTMLTVPVVTLAGGAVGAAVMAARAWRGRAFDAGRAPGMLLLISAGGAIGPFVLLGSTPIFGAEKHWAPAIPSICVAAGVGIVWAGRQAAAGLAARWPALRARARLVEGGAITLVAGLAIAAAATETARSHPYGLTHYNALAGGAPGGADLGMNRQFWGVAARGVLPWLREQPPGPVYTHDASPAWGLYLRRGWLPPGFRDSGWETAGIARSTYALVIHERHFNRHDYLIWKAYGTTQPAFVLRAHGVPIVSVYRRPAPAAPRAP